MTQRHIKLVAIQFSKLLRQVLNPAEMEIINQRNEGNEIHHVCASLIYASTEAVFKDAFYKALHKEYDWLNPEHEEVRKDAWNYARISGFAPFDGVEVYETLNNFLRPFLKYDDYNQPMEDAKNFIHEMEADYKFKP